MRESLLSYIQELLSAQLPFLLLRKSNTTEVEILSQTNRKLHEIAHDRMTCAIFSKFQKEENQIFIYGEVNRRFEWNAQDVELDIKPISLEKSEKKDHFTRIENAIYSIKNSALQKVVLSLIHEIRIEKNTTKILANLLDAYPNANCYFFYHPEVGSWMGATPETLLSYNKNEVKTMSLAGTLKGKNEAEIRWGNKEKEEQQLVTDYVVNALQNITETEVNIGPVKTVRAGNIFHLQTLLSARMPIDKINDLIQQLHPTPAVCGLPKKEALECISKLENYNRSFYTGYFGINNPTAQTADYFVNLRCMELSDTSIKLFAGGGITALSDPALEVQEVENKLMTMASIL